jgi:hypothetical protein
MLELSIRFCHAINGGCIALYKPVFHKSSSAFKELNSFVWIWGLSFLGGDYEDCFIQGCDAV